MVSHSSSPANPLGLLLVNLDNAARRVLTQPEVKDGSDVDPRFSPDGRSITFLRSVHRGQQELYSIPVAGGTPKALTQDASQISAHDWEAGGEAIYFASDKGGEFRLWRQPVAGGAPQPVGLFGSFPLQFSLSRSMSFVDLRGDQPGPQYLGI